MFDQIQMDQVLQKMNPCDPSLDSFRTAPGLL